MGHNMLTRHLPRWPFHIWSLVASPDNWGRKTKLWAALSNLTIERRAGWLWSKLPKPYHKLHGLTSQNVLLFSIETKTLWSEEQLLWFCFYWSRVSLFTWNPLQCKLDLNIWFFLIFCIFIFMGVIYCLTTIATVIDEMFNRSIRS